MKLNLTVLSLHLLISLESFSAQSDSMQIESEVSPLTGAYFGQEPPGDVPELFAPGIVSTGKEHSAAMFTPDGTEVWFGRIFPATVWYARFENGSWTRPSAAPFCDDYDQLYPLLSHDGTRLYYTSTRPPSDDDKPLGRGNGHIWVVEREGRTWSEPYHLPGTVNFSTRHSCGSVAEDGTIYFTAKMNGRSMDIFRCRLTDSGHCEARPLSALNSDSPDHSPFVAPDQSYLIFSSFRGGVGSSDLFISFRLPDSTWCGPVNMGDRINSAWKDEYPYVSPDGKYLFFNSNRPSELNDKPIPDGPGNIFWIKAEIIDELRSLIQK